VVVEKEQIFSDDDVVRSVRGGNIRDFEILVERYKHKIINFIYKMIYDYDEAQSLTQEVFLKVYETLKRYNTQNNFQAFIFTIAKNLTLNYISKQKRLISFSKFLPARDDGAGNYDDDSLFPDDESESQHSLMEKQQQEEMFTAALKELKENQRIALILKVYLEFSYNQIKEVTGWSIPKIETLISRAKSNLIKYFHSVDNDPANKKKRMQEIKNRTVL